MISLIIAGFNVSASDDEKDAAGADDFIGQITRDAFEAGRADGLRRRRGDSDDAGVAAGAKSGGFWNNLGTAAKGLATFENAGRALRAGTQAARGEYSDAVGTVAGDDAAQLARDAAQLRESLETERRRNVVASFLGKQKIDYKKVAVRTPCGDVTNGNVCSCATGAASALCLSWLFG